MFSISELSFIILILFHQKSSQVSISITFCSLFYFFVLFNFLFSLYFSTIWWRRSISPNAYYFSISSNQYLTLKTIIHFQSRIYCSNLLYWDINQFILNILLFDYKIYSFKIKFSDSNLHSNWKVKTYPKNWWDILLKSSNNHI